MRRNRLGDHIDTLSAAFALARALMFAGYSGEAEEQAADCERQAASLLHASSRMRVRVASMRAQLLDDRGLLQEAEEKCSMLAVLLRCFREDDDNMGTCRYESVLDDQLAYFGMPLLLLPLLLLCCCWNRRCPYAMLCTHYTSPILLLRINVKFQERLIQIACTHARDTCRCHILQQMRD